MSNSFSGIIISWYHKNKRDLPWRQTTDPYKIWLSEIILQQTRVIQGLPYYEKFVSTFPTVQDLAAADEQQILRLWQGLGYYSRARNLHACAKMVVESFDGKFPQTAAELKKLKGIGDYTAAAIASFSFREPVPVLDGNVFRVISRYFGITADIADPKNKKEFYPILEEVIDVDRPDAFNQAIMEFGAMHCTPAKPLCLYCELQSACFAFQNQQQNQLPVKIKKVKVRNRYFHYLVLISDGKVYMKERGANDIWQGLHDFHLIENKAEHNSLDELLDESQLTASELIDESAVFKHILTHQRIFARFHVISVRDKKPFADIISTMRGHDFETVSSIPKPKLIDNYLNEVFFSLALYTDKSD